MKLESWYLGFNWIFILFTIACGLASYYYTSGWTHWISYGLFVISLIYMLTKFRLYQREPWRRKHAQGMGIFGKLARQELAAAKKEKRNVIIPPLYEQLAKDLLGPDTDSQGCIAGRLTDVSRRAYYHRLVDAYPAVFTGRVKPEYHAQALDSIRKDIDASEMGPDIVIAFAIEKEYGTAEAARYLLAIASGRTAQGGLFM